MYRITRSEYKFLVFSTECRQLLVVAGSTVGALCSLRRISCTQLLVSHAAGQLLD